MKTKFLIRIIFFFVFFTAAAVPYSSIAQDNKPEQKQSTRKKQSQAAKEKQRKAKKLKKYEAESQKHQLNIQTKETRKRMKRNKKRTQAIRDNKKELFFITWFRKRQ